MAIQIQNRRDTASNWTSANPTLAQGEFGIETDTLKVKVGNGTTAWTSLAYISGGSMTYPGAGIPLSTGSAWGTSISGTSSQFVKADGSLDSTVYDKTLTPVATKTANYTANANEIVPCNISAGSFAVTLPTAPADGTRVRVQLLTVGTNKNLEVKTGGSDKFFATAGPTSLYMYIYGETQEFQYQASGAFWNGVTSAPTSNFANNFPGIDAITPISNTDITIDATARTLTITPSLGFFNIYVDGGGKTVKHRKTTVVFGDGSGSSGNNTWTDTSGSWYFYFDSNGQPVTTQTPWKPEDFPFVAPVYRALWNSTLSGTAKLVAQYVEYHLNDIPADVHQWFHLQGAIWGGGSGNFDLKCNPLVSAVPASNGTNTCLSLTTGKNVDDNLEYTITNDTSGNPWTQDMGNITPASITSSNAGQFKIFVQDGSANVSFLSATRYPFDWNSSTNVPNYITSTGTRTPVSNNYFFVYFIYATQNPVTGEAIKVVSAPAEYSTLTNARAFGWTDIQNTYSIFGSDMEIRPLYRIIYEHKSTYDVGSKYAVLRETQDLRKAAVTSTSVTTGSLPASSVTVVPSGTIASTNVQSALTELDTEKVPYTGATGAVDIGSYDMKATSFTIGSNTLATSEFGYLDGQDQTVKTNSSPQFAHLGIGTAASTKNALQLAANLGNAPYRCASFDYNDQFTIGYNTGYGEIRFFISNDDTNTNYISTHATVPPTLIKSTPTGGLIFLANTTSAGVGNPVSISEIMSLSASGKLLTVGGETVETKTDNYGVALTDCGKVLEMNSSSAKTFTLPSVSSTNAGVYFIFRRIGTGKMTILANDSATINDSTAGGTIYNDLSAETGFAQIKISLNSTGTKWVASAGVGTFITT